MINYLIATLKKLIIILIKVTSTTSSENKSKHTSFKSDLLSFNGRVLTMIVLLALQSCVHNTWHLWYTKGHWLTRQPYLTIIASYTKFRIVMCLNGRKKFNFYLLLGSVAIKFNANEREQTYACTCVKACFVFLKFYKNVNWNKADRSEKCAMILIIGSSDANLVA